MIQDIKCSSCGNKYAEGTKYCLGCGRIIQESEEKEFLIIKISDNITSKLSRKWNYKPSLFSRFLLRIIRFNEHSKMKQEYLINKFFEEPDTCPNCQNSRKYRKKYNKPNWYIFAQSLKILNTYTIKCRKCNWQYKMNDSQLEIYETLDFSPISNPLHFVIRRW